MTNFTEVERAYVDSNWVGHLATASGSGEPDVALVTVVVIDDLAVHVVGNDLIGTTKFRNVGNTGRACLMIDDLPSVNPLLPRGIKVSGRATQQMHQGRASIRIIPEKVSTWGLTPSGYDGTVTVRDIGPQT